jgi:hypothetical protein
MKKASIFISIFLIAVNISAQTNFSTYVNPRFGFSISYPSYLIQSRLPDNGAGISFKSPDGCLSISAQGHFLNGLSLSTMWNHDLTAYGNSITYKVKRNDWFVVSGVANGFEYYRKTFVKGGNWCSFVITYPHGQNERYDPVVEQIAKNFSFFGW